jgi:transcriptional regulator with XRE-family HTH domain
MEWAKTVRALRLRLRLKQGAMAELIGVSQTYISRLEAGIVEPAPHVAEAIRRLSRDPRTRSTFDDFVATVRHSPFHCFLVQPDPGAGRYTVEAVSPSLARAAPVASESSDLGACPRLEPMREQIDAVCAAGLNEGRILSAMTFWKDGSEAPRCWTTLYIPIRDETGTCFIHGAVTELDPDEFERRRTEAGQDIVLTLFEPDAVAVGE